MRNRILSCSALLLVACSNLESTARDGQSLPDVALSRDAQPLADAAPARDATTSADGAEVTHDAEVFDAAAADAGELLDALRADAVSGADDAALADVGRRDAATSSDAGPDRSFWPDTTDLALISQAALPVPGYLQEITDPSLGNRLMRITDEAAFGGYSSSGSLRMLKHHYAKDQPFNADESLLFLPAQYPGALLDGRSYAYLRRLPSFDVDMERVWSNVAPHLMYGVKSNPAALKVLDLSTDSESVLASFPRYDWLSLGNYEGNLSDDDRRVCLMGQRGPDLEVFVYDLPSRTILGTKVFPSTTHGADVDFCSVSPSGNYVVLDSPARTLDLYDPQMRFIRTLSMNANHLDFGFDQAGDEVAVGSNSSTGDIWHQYIFSTRLRDGRERVELPPGSVNNPTHTSCRNVGRPGWCYVSEFANTDAAHPVTYYDTFFNYNEVFAVKLDGSGTIERVAKEHHVTDPRFDYGANEGYARSAMAVPSRLGDRVIFASDWGDDASAAFVHTYVSWWAP